MMCDNCKKYPLELREINEVTDFKGRDKVLCDKCYMELKGKDTKRRV